MVNQTEQLKIYYDIEEKKFKKKYVLTITIITLLSIVVSTILQKNDPHNLFFYIPLILFLPFIPNMILLKKIKCPSCGKNYFHSFLASKDDIKKLLKSNPKCINCNNEAEIISEYKAMY